MTKLAAMSMLLAVAIAAVSVALGTDAAAGSLRDPLVAADYQRQTANPDHIEIVSDPAGGKRQVFHMKVEQTDAKTNGGLRSEVLRRGEYSKQGVRWYALSVFIPASWMSDRRLTIIAQIHTSQKKLKKVSPPIAFTVRGDQQQLQLHSSTRNLSAGEVVDRTSADEVLVPMGSLKKAAWQCFVVRADWSWSPGKGALDIWRNGEQIYSAKDQPNSYETELGNYPKVGLYEPGGMEVPSREIFADAIRVGGPESNYDEMYKQTPCAT